MEQSKVKDLPGILLGAAMQAFVVALLLSIAIQVTLPMAAGIMLGMAPQAPPGMTPKADLSWMADLKGLYHRYSYQTLWILSFVVMVAFRISHNTKLRPVRRWKVRLRWFGSQLAEKWLSLLFLNAFLCFFAAILFSVMQQASPFRWLTDMVLTAIQPVIYRIASLFFNAGQIGTAQSFIDWYHANELKFTFWLLYTSAILDDFGLPNLKSLAKLIWRRIYPKRSDSTSQASDQEQPAEPIDNSSTIEYESDPATPPATSDAVEK